MLPYLAVGLGIVLGVAMLAQWFANADPKVLAKVLRWVGAVVGLGFVAFMVVTGRLGLLIGAAAVLAPFLLRYFGRGRLFGGPLGRGQARRPQPGATSELRTDALHAVLDHDSGRLTGAVLAGRFAGRALEGLSREELVVLWQDLAQDAQSRAVLEAYLDREHGPDWRDAAAGAANGAASGRAGMTREEACQILNVADGASREDIETAYREAMLRNHPDRGGSNWLAAKINEAKAVLLGD